MKLIAKSVFKNVDFAAKNWNLIAIVIVLIIVKDAVNVAVKTGVVMMDSAVIVKVAIAVEIMIAVKGVIVWSSDMTSFDIYSFT